MRNAKRLLALAVALASTLSFAACGGSESSGDGATTTIAGKDLDSEAQEIISDAADKIDWGNTDLANKEVKWLSHYDINPTDGKVKDPAIQLFEDVYGGQVTWVSATWETRYTKLASLVSANDSPDMFPADDMDGFPMGAIKGMFQPVDDYIDFDKEYWETSLDLCEQFSLAGKRFVAAIYTNSNLVCVYNRSVVEESGFEDPAELYANGEWTWEEMRDMAISFTDKENDKYGFDGYWWADAISLTTGVPMIGIEDGKLVNNLESPELQKAQDFIYDMTKANVGFPRHENNWAPRDGVNGFAGVGQGLTLFLPVGLWGIEDTLANTAAFGDVEAGEVMFVPMPSEDGSEPNMPTRVHGYFLVAGAKNPEGFGAFMLCQKIASTQEDIKEVGNNTLRNDYGWTEEMIEMREECNRLSTVNPVFEFKDAISNEVTTAFYNIAGATSNPGDPVTWASVVAENINGVNYYVDDTNAKIEEAVKKLSE